MSFPSSVKFNNENQFIEIDNRQSIIYNNLQILKQDMLSNKQDRHSYTSLEQQSMQLNISSLDSEKNLATRPYSQPSLNLKQSFQALYGKLKQIDQNKKQDFCEDNEQSSNKQHQNMEELKRQNEILKRQARKIHILSQQNDMLRQQAGEVRILSAQIRLMSIQVYKLNIFCRQNCYTKKMFDKLKDDLYEEVQEREKMRKELGQVKQLLLAISNSNKF